MVLAAKFAYESQVEGIIVSDRLDQFPASATVVNKSAGAIQSDRLQEFLDLAGPLLKSMPKDPKGRSLRPQIETARLEDIFQDLHGPLGALKDEVPFSMSGR